MEVFTILNAVKDEVFSVMETIDRQIAENKVQQISASERRDLRKN